MTDRFIMATGTFDFPGLPLPPPANRGARTAAGPLS